VFALLDGVGGPEVMVIGVLALLMFGSKRLPELARSLGKAMREFKRATREVEDNIREAMREEPAPRIRPPAKQIPSSANPATAVKTEEATKTSEPEKGPQNFPKQHGDTF
jgi:sec-independent protein translocase protein TatA